jgi:replicative DNA helicase
MSELRVHGRVLVIETTGNHGDLSKDPPYAIEAEQAVLGSILIDRDALIQVADTLRPEDFYRRAHAIIYQAMLDVYEGGEPPDVVLISERIEKNGDIDAIGGRSYLGSLTAMTPTSVHALSYARIVGRKAVLRRMIGVAGKIAGLAYGDPDDTDEALDQASAFLYQIAEKKTTGEYTALSPLLHEAYDRIDFLHQNKGQVSGISSGFRDLDQMTQGFQNADLIILAARPSVGKTSLALNLAQHISSTIGKSIGMFSLEMSKEQLVMRLISSVSDIDSQKLRSGFMEDGDFSKLAHGLGVLDKARLYIDDSPSLTIMELRTKARRMKMEVGMDLLIIDYLQLMHAPGASGKDANRVQEVSAISRGLKTLARELDVPVIALSQLSRGVESRDSAEPRLSDLRESGSIEQDADLVLFLWRKKTVDDDTDTEDGDFINVKLAKNRNGPIGDFQLWFRKHQTRFYSVDERYG